ncbi:CTP synthase C-terminal region-related (seleno)protein [Nonomuraea africana]|uniref:CTP synthase (glutamine hydrolyzing) n=1 Tax=Nonomuraea africana TaxID=46171 RepID=A0ABR9KN19_9ACTN|nr:gamma-glutamyl-gamma-aminobutyrate hydrolase family protein [Nonomuraea africana]MBE1562947.1 CTP synthase (UTP-ammonia lyase) [Nonomuraea africana]
MRLALVGDRSPTVRSHVRVPLLLEALREREGITLDAYWIPTEEAGELSGFDGVWLLPGSPYRSESGAVSAIRAAREQAIPFLGTCAGFQHAMLEYARNVCALDVAHAEYEPGTERGLLIAPLACSLVGHEGEVRLAPGSLIRQAVGAERAIERYHCSFGLNADYLPALEAGGLRFTAHDEDGRARAAELPGHPFYLATLFQPELSGDGSRPHPVITAFSRAVAASVRVGSS